MAGALTTIGFDADDTLWQNEQFFLGREAIAFNPLNTKDCLTF